MTENDLQRRIFERCYYLDMTMQVILAAIKNDQANKKCIARLIDFQMEAYGELRELLTHCEQASDTHLEIYDSLLHQLRTGFLLWERGIVTKNTTGL